MHGSHICGGSIVSPMLVLTAGHCAEYPVRSYTVRAGSSNWRTGGSLHEVKELIVHQGYDYSGVPVNDIALAQVSPNFELDETRQIVPLYTKAATPGSEALITGWGSELLRTTYLRAVTVPIISKEQCKEQYESEIELPDGQICAAASEGGKDACQGDSGGPLVINGSLAGVVSWGIGCAEKEHPGVYTEVAYYIPWIKKNSL